MADEQDEWLDREAAEKLLRGEPVVPPGAQARSAARSLAETLGAARSVPPADGELAGEEAALAAFRQVGPVRGASGTGRHRRPAGPVPEAGTAPGEGMLDPVRLGAPPSTPPSPSRRERPRFGRPVRIGLVASLAGCALGGVAVAAGTGALTGAFGGAEHGPAATVSVAASPDGSAPEAPGTDGPSGTPDGTGDASGGSAGETPGGTGVTGGTGDAGTTPGAGGPDGRNGTGDSGTRAGGHGNGNGDGTSGRGTFGDPDGPGVSGGSGGADTGWYAAALEDCDDYRDGHLDDRERRRLAQLARGEKNIEAYCATLTRSPRKDSGGGDGPDGSASNGAGAGSDHTTGGHPHEGDQDTFQQSRSSAFSLRNAPADGPATPPRSARDPGEAASPAPGGSAAAPTERAKRAERAERAGRAGSAGRGKHAASGDASEASETAKGSQRGRGGYGSDAYAAPAPGALDQATSGWT